MTVTFKIGAAARLLPPAEAIAYLEPLTALKQTVPDGPWNLTAGPINPDDIEHGPCGLVAIRPGAEMDKKTFSPETEEEMWLWIAHHHVAGRQVFVGLPGFCRGSLQ